MRPDPLLDTRTLPQTRNELQLWVREHLRLPATTEQTLLNAIDTVFTRHERLWQESKHEAIQALSAGFADKTARVKRELLAKDATVSSISRYFEALVADLTDKSHRDPKTKLMNFGRFTEQLESFLALEQRGRWCAVGLVDITGFKWYNDALGPAICCARRYRTAPSSGSPTTAKHPPLPRTTRPTDLLHSKVRTPCGGRSSVAERLTVAQEVAGSIPVAHPNYNRRDSAAL